MIYKILQDLHEMDAYARGAVRARRSIHEYSQIMIPMKPNTPSHGANGKSSGTSPIGASFERPTMRPALTTPQRLSPTINPDATRVPSRSARSGLGVRRARRLYHSDNTAPIT